MDDELRLQLLQGCFDKRVKLKLTHENLSLQDLLKYARSLEFCSEPAVGEGYRKEVGDIRRDKRHGQKRFQETRGKKRVTSVDTNSHIKRNALRKIKLVVLVAKKVIFQGNAMARSHRGKQTNGVKRLKNSQICSRKNLVS